MLPKVATGCIMSFRNIIKQQYEAYFIVYYYSLTKMERFLN